MKRVDLKPFLRRIFFPPKWVSVTIPPVSAAVLTAVFVFGYTQSAAAYIAYCMSAYSLIILICAVPRIKTAVQKSGLYLRITSSDAVKRYLNDMFFRGGVSIYQGMLINFCYVIFRIIASVRYMSVWFVSMAVYYFVLGCIRLYLISGFRKRKNGNEYLYYRRTALTLFVLNIPMGGMILLMITTDSGYSYPGYIIYLSAAYAFYAVIRSVVNIVKYRKLSSPILTASKLVNLVCAVMSMLGLQTAMIAQFSADGESFRRIMNTVTGTAVYAVVIIIAVCMLVHCKKTEKRGESLE